MASAIDSLSNEMSLRTSTALHKICTQVYRRKISRQEFSFGVTSSAIKLCKITLLLLIQRKQVMNSIETFSDFSPKLWSVDPLF